MRAGTASPFTGAPCLQVVSLRPADRRAPTGCQHSGEPVTLGDLAGYARRMERPPAAVLALYRFEAFDVIRRRWVRARHVASLADLGADGRPFRIVGPPELRTVSNLETLTAGRLTRGAQGRCSQDGGAAVPSSRGQPNGRKPFPSSPCSQHGVTPGADSVVLRIAIRPGGHPTAGAAGGYWWNRKNWSTRWTRNPHHRTHYCNGTATDRGVFDAASDRSWRNSLNSWLPDLGSNQGPAD